MDGTRKYAWCPGFRWEARIFLRAEDVGRPEKRGQDLEVRGPVLFASGRSRSLVLVDHINEHAQAAHATAVEMKAQPGQGSEVRVIGLVRKGRGEFKAAGHQ